LYCFPFNREIPSERWTRPEVPALDPKADGLTFQQVDIDHYMGKPMWRLENNSERGELIMPENNVLIIKKNNKTKCTN